MNYPINNKPVLNKLTTRSLRTNRMRNLFTVLAIALTTFLLSAVFTTGISYFDSFQKQSYLTAGTTAQAELSSPQPDQLGQLEALSYVESVGRSVIAGLVETHDDDFSAALTCYDESEWKHHRRPAVTQLAGGYPQAENEVMLSRWTAGKLGFGNLKPGSKFTLTYRTQQGEQTREFILCGLYTDGSALTAANSGTILVSQAFVEEMGLNLRQPDAVSVKVKGDTNKGVSRLTEEIPERSGQEWNTSVTYSSSSDLYLIYLAVGVLVLFIMLSGYLLIYNVLYISVTREIHFYGLLKTIGTTPRQIRRMVRGQALRLAAIGIPAGLLLGAGVSYLFVPGLISALSGSALRVGVSFHPLILAFAALFALLTTLIGCVKPARVAARISPVEAVRFTGQKISRKHRGGTRGGKLYRMAWHNIFRDKKRAIVVFLSLFLGITTFLSVNTVVLSLDVENYLNQYSAHDFTLTNKTAAVGSDIETEQKFSPAFLAALRELDGVEKMHLRTKESCVIQFDEAVFGRGFEAFCNQWGASYAEQKQGIEQNPELYWALLGGADEKAIGQLEAETEQGIDRDAFERGETVLLQTRQPELYNLGDPVQITVNGQVRDYQIGGFVSGSLQFKEGGSAPNLFVSEAELARIFDDPIIDQIELDTDRSKSEAILTKIQSMVGNDNQIGIDSRLQMEESMRESKIMMQVAGSGMAVVLALIGLLNFVNVMFTSVSVRRGEFAILESIGMTKKQVRKMLLFEGLGYGVISILLIATLGTAAAYWLFTVLSKEASYAVFTYPVLPVAAALLLILAICLLVPLAAYRSLCRGSVSERLRSAE